jgi:hypothetical protein
MEHIKKPWYLFACALNLRVFSRSARGGKEKDFCLHRSLYWLTNPCQNTGLNCILYPAEVPEVPTICGQTRACCRRNYALQAKDQNYMRQRMSLLQHKWHSGRITSGKRWPGRWITLDGLHMITAQMGFVGGRRGGGGGGWKSFEWPWYINSDNDSEMKQALCNTLTELVQPQN